jgi:hypothetical protein
MRRIVLPLLTTILLSCLPFANSVRAQEVDCTVQVNFEAVSLGHKDLLVDFAADIREYLRGHRWGSDDSGDKIQCALNIFIQAAIGENRYAAQAFIGSQRPIYNSDKNTAVLRLLDDQWEFTYVRNRPIIHDLYTYNDLTSFLDFYMYVIIGCDYDSYEPLSGNAYFQKAADVANLGRSNGAKGWQQTTTSYSKLKLIDELLNPKFAPLRLASYRYHYAGLDSLSTNPANAYKNIIRAVEEIGKLRTEVDPRNASIRAFFDTKAPEIADLFQTYDDPSVYLKFIKADPSHQTIYEQYLSRRKQN